MVPLILPGDKIGKIKSKSKYDINDIIVFRQKARLISHRIVWVEMEKGIYITRGDNNRHADAPVMYTDILGEVNTVSRHGHNLVLSNLYRMQSLNYSAAISLFTSAATRDGLPFVILKGLPVHLRYLDRIPRTLLVDLDILIHRRDRQKLERILVQCGFVPVGLHSEGSTQYNYAKLGTPFHVVFDIHLEPAIAFTRVPSLNRLIPQESRISRLLWENVEKISIDSDALPTLNREAQVFYLILHAFHHNLRGSQRLWLFDRIVATSGVDLDRLLEMIGNCRIQDISFIVFSKLYRLFPETRITKSILAKLRPTTQGKIAASYYLNHSKTWNSQPKILARLELLVVIALISPLPFIRKFKIIFSGRSLKSLIPQLFLSR